MDKPHIVLVEDDDVLADFLMQRLKLSNMDATRYANGTDAVMGIITGNKVDLMLLDISLPDIDGFEVLKRLADFQKTAKIPVIVVSNFSQDKDIEWGKKLGVKQFLNKASLTPVDIVDLVHSTLTEEKTPHTT